MMIHAMHLLGLRFGRATLDDRATRLSVIVHLLHLLHAATAIRKQPFAENRTPSRHHCAAGSVADRVAAGREAHHHGVPVGVADHAVGDLRIVALELREQRAACRRTRSALGVGKLQRETNLFLCAGCRRAETPRHSAPN
jgi:hypothetical protein